jgi:hypothetical protein
MRAIRPTMVLGSASLVLLAAGFVLGQQTAPIDYKSVTENVLAAIDLAPEIDNVANRELRLSRSVERVPEGPAGAALFPAMAPAARAEVAQSIHILISVMW